MEPSHELDTGFLGFVKAVGLAVAVTLSMWNPPLSEAASAQKIQIRPYRVHLERKSATQRVFLLKTVSPVGVKPTQGRIVLLRTADTHANAFAVRVLRTYEGDTFAGTRVRSYKSLTDLKPGQEFIAMEMAGLADETTGALPEPIAEPRAIRRENVDGLKEVESGLGLVPDVMDYDPELDAGNSPIELAPEAPAPRLHVEEAQLFDDDANGLNFCFGMIRALSPSGGSATFGAGGLRYARTINRNLFFYSPKLQDSLSLELGMFLLKVSNYDPPSATTLDSFTLFPIEGTLRYNTHFNQDWSGYFYLGLMKYIIVDATNYTATGTNNLSAFMPAVGAGLLYRLGPRWYLRANLGLDMIDVGFTLRF